MDINTGISRWGIFSWEKWYQDEQFWFSSFFLGHILWDNVEVQISPFSAKARFEWMSFPAHHSCEQLIHFNVVNEHSLQQRVADPKVLILVSIFLGEDT